MAWRRAVVFVAASLLCGHGACFLTTAPARHLSLTPGAFGACPTPTTPTPGPTPGPCMSHVWRGGTPGLVVSLTHAWPCPPGRMSRALGGLICVACRAVGSLLPGAARGGDAGAVPSAHDGHSAAFRRTSCHRGYGRVQG